MNSLGFIASALVLLSASCGRKDASAAWWQKERERIELAHSLELKEMRYEQMNSGSLPKLEELRKSNQIVAASISSLKQHKITATEEIEDLESQFSGFRESVLAAQRNLARGKTFATLATASGRKYQDVVIASIDDSGVSIRHAEGSARLRYADLDSNQRVLFGLDGELAAAATQRENLEIAAYERWTDEQLAIHTAKKEKLADASLREELLNKENRRLAAARVSAASSSPLAQPARSFSSSYSRSYSTYRRSRPFYRYVYYTPSYCNTPSYYNRSYCSSRFIQNSTSVSRYPSGCYAPPNRETSRKSISDFTLPFNP